MSTYLLGATITVQATFKDNAGNLYDPTGVTYTLTPPLGSSVPVTTLHWHVAPFSDDPALVHDSTGIFHVDNVPTAGGQPWRWEFVSTAPTPRAIGASFAILDPSASGWPAPWGYCDVQDIQARINSSSWNPDQTGEFPSAQVVEQFIAEGASTIDAALIRFGYYVPIRPQTGQVIMPQLWFLLRNINAAYGTGMVERSRHGSIDQSEDPNAAHWIQIFDDMLTRLEQGDDNLFVFGADGPFPPVADASLGISFGQPAFAVAAGVPLTAPFFDSYMCNVSGTSADDNVPNDDAQQWRAG